MITKNDCRGKKSLLAAVIFALMDLRDFRFQLVGEGKELFGGHRLSEQEALRVVAIVVKQELFLLFRLNAFAEHQHIEIVAERHDAAHDFLSAVGRFGGKQHRPVFMTSMSRCWSIAMDE